MQVRSQDGGTRTVTESGRIHQKARTRAAIVDATRQLISSGQPVTMPVVARAAQLSEPTAYRYFPDLYTLLTAALDGMWPTPAQALAPVADSTDPVERVAFAARYLGRHVLKYEGAIRIMISATIGRPDLARARPGIRLGLIDEALDPLTGLWAVHGSKTRDRLKQDLSVVISAESVFSLVDLYQLRPATAVASLVRSASAITRDALAQRVVRRGGESGVRASTHAR
jgi:AcrR family transcriptional regulator